MTLGTCFVGRTFLFLLKCNTEAKIFSNKTNVFVPISKLENIYLLNGFNKKNLGVINVTFFMEWSSIIIIIIFTNNLFIIVSYLKSG